MKIRKYKNGAVIVSQGMGLELIGQEEEEVTELTTHGKSSEVLQRIGEKGYGQTVKELKEQEKVDEKEKGKIR